MMNEEGIPETHADYLATLTPERVAALDEAMRLADAKFPDDPLGNTSAIFGLSEIEQHIVDECKRALGGR